MWKQAIALGGLCAFAGCSGSADSMGPDGTSADVSKKACSPTSPREADSLELFISPQDTDQPLADVIASATESVRVMVYILDAGPIKDAIIARASTPGVTVQVLLDKSEEVANTNAFNQLTSLGASVEWSDPQFTFMHAKFAVVDAKTALVGTGNYSAKLNSEERNLFVKDTDAQDVANLVTLFDADFARDTPSLPCTRLLVSPINSLAGLTTLINGAKKSIYIESMQFADADIRSAVAARAKKGVEVRALLADPSWISTNTDAATFLEQNDIPVRRMVSPMVHIKNIIIDGKRTYMGSENLSATSLTMNREVGIVVTDADTVSRILESFESDWANAVDFFGATDMGVDSDPSS